MKTFYFNTGVKISVNPHIKGGIDSGNGIVVIPFQCYNVPDNATFLHACDNPNPANERIIVREIFNSGLHSKYAHFAIQTHL
jgi:hypothetical protein